MPGGNDTRIANEKCFSRVQVFRDFAQLLPLPGPKATFTREPGTSCGSLLTAILIRYAPAI